MNKTIILGHVVYHEGMETGSQPFYDNGLRAPGENTFTSNIGNAAIYCEQAAKERAKALNDAIPKKHPLKDRICYGELKIERKSAL